MKRVRFVLLCLLVFGASISLSPGLAQADPAANEAAHAQVKAQQGASVQGSPHKRNVPIFGLIAAPMVDTVDVAPAAAPGSAPAAAEQATVGCTTEGDNVRINSDCGFRPQNETAIAVNPRNPNNLIAGSNDYRLGDGLCPYEFSLDGAQHWGDGTLPVSPVITNDPAYTGDTFTTQKRKYFHVGGDPTVAFDADGVAYSTCGLFDRFDVTQPRDAQPRFGDNALYVARSFTGGAHYQRNGQDTRQQPQGLGGINGNGPVPVVEHYRNSRTGDTRLADKQYMTADTNPNSPFKNYVYVTWTDFFYRNNQFQSAQIYFSRSRDQGYSFEAPRAISGSSPLCARPGNLCIANQFSNPFVGPDGTLYVTWVNFDNPVSGNENRNQILMVKSTNGGGTWSSPIKVADFYDLPECAPGDGSLGAQLSRGRECVGTGDVNGGTDSSHFRATNYPSAVVDPTNPSTIYVHFGSYINQFSGEATTGCEPRGLDPGTGNNLYVGHCRNHIVQATSTDGGSSFDGTTTDPRDLPVISGDNDAHQWWQWTSAAPNGRVDVSYYDRQYEGCQASGCQDITLASLGSDQAVQPSAVRVKPAVRVNQPGANANPAANLTLALKRVTTSSMPPPTQFGGVFMGDYMGMASTNDFAYPLWTDTRRRDTQPFDTFQPGSPSGVPLNDQDAVTARVEPAANR